MCLCVDARHGLPADMASVPPALQIAPVPPHMSLQAMKSWRNLRTTRLLYAMAQMEQQAKWIVPEAARKVASTGQIARKCDDGVPSLGLVE